MMRLKQLVFVLLMPFILLGGMLSLLDDLAAQPETPPTTAVSTADDEARQKIDPTLLALATGRARYSTLPVLVHFKGPVVWSGLADKWLVRPYTGPHGEQTAVVHIPGRNLIKLASQEAVVRVGTAVNPIQPPHLPFLESGPPPNWPAQLAAIRSQPHNLRSLPAESRTPDDWMDIGDVHEARAAWDAGYTGQGVKILVNDSGIDFCHPDLITTWAVVDDPGSPYDGWPLMFDSYSMYLYALDQHFGQTNVADGLADYADTSATCSGTPCNYQPIGAASAHAYTLTASSQSGTYHIGDHPDTTLEGLYGERVAVLVVDENSANVYDTVYVDLDNDYDFSDETPATKNMPIACVDNYDSLAGSGGADGYNDLSGGLIYFIADGTNPIPASDWLWGGLTPGNGDLVAFTLVDRWETGHGHGQFVSANIAARGIIDGENANSPAWKPPGSGMVYGVSSQAKIVNNGNFYQSPFVEDGFLFAALGYDGISGTVDDSQIINNSWGESQTFHDGWDSQSRLLDWLSLLNPELSIVVSSGNSGPGYGSNYGPAPADGMKVGASTLFGSIAYFDSITDTNQILWGDIIPFSSRGPGANGSNGVDVTANGAIGTMDLPLNMVGDGWQAWGIWAGTSRSTPIAAGILSLIYDAYFQANGRWPTAAEAKAILAAGAADQHYDSFSQGAGMVKAHTAALIAAGEAGFYVSPFRLTFGDYRGERFPAFAKVMAAGEVATAVLTITNPTASPVLLTAVSDQLVRSETITFTFTSEDITLEDANSLDPDSRKVPDYLIPISNMVPLTADLMEVNLIFPFDQFDPDGDSNNNNHQYWWLQVINWTDVNGDMNLWQDLNGNGVVNQGEIDAYEYNRFSYDNRQSNGLQVQVQQPASRMIDGLFIDLRHRRPRNTVPTTTIQIELVFYEHTGWDWLTLPSGLINVPAGGQVALPLTMTVPGTAVPGAYSGFVQVSGAGQQSQLPMMVNVAARLDETEAPVVFGGQPPAATNYDNGRVQGHLHWDGDAAFGDWRFFFAEAENLSPAATMIVSTTWQDRQPFVTDIDTLVYGPTMDGFSQNVPDFFGPYSLIYLASSQLTYKGDGRWDYQTSTGGPADMVTTPVVDGLHLVMAHNVLYQGDDFSVPFTQTVSTAVLEPAPIVIQACGDSGSVPLTLRTNGALPSLQGDTFGLAQPQMLTGQTVGQDVYVDPGSASYTQTLTLTNTGRLEIVLAGHAGAVTPSGLPGNDLDLYLLFDENDNGAFDWNNEILARSIGYYSDEFVTVDLPQDGDYLIAVHGARVSNPPAQFDLRVLPVAGNDLSLIVPSGPIAVGETAVTLNWNKTVTLGETWQGVIYLGPATAPGALKADVRLIGCGVYMPLIFK